jgi:hypothetical protein
MIGEKRETSRLAYERRVVGIDYLPISKAYFARTGKESKRVAFSDARDFGVQAPTVRHYDRRPDETRRLKLRRFRGYHETPINRARLTPASLGN